MARKRSIERFSADQLATLPSETDWAKVDATTAAEIERQGDTDTGPLPGGWADTVVLGTPEPKQDVHIRLDQTVLQWFKAAGPGYQTRINAVLRSFVQAKQRDARPGA